MLRISQLIIQNFGPYRGRHSLSISEDDGVTIIWGDNGYGKTTIMNAFRYVLWGNIFGRKRQYLPPYTFVNIPSLEDGGDMLVELYMNYNGNDCVVSRGLHRVNGEGKIAEDYETIFYVKLGTITLNKEESKEFLATAFPDRISRFYLFDGELLGEYEDLLDEQDESGSNIKQSIEDILGIPVLENAKKNLESICGVFNKEAANLAKKDQSTQQISTALEKEQEELEHQEQSKKDLEKKLAEALEEQKTIDEKMATNSLFSEYIGQRIEMEKKLKTDQDSLKEAKDRIVPSIEDAWKEVLNPVINEAIDCLHRSVAGIQQKENDGKSLLSVSEFIATHLASHPGSCPVCDHILSDNIREAILNRFKKENFFAISQEEKAQLDFASSRIAMLRGSIVDSKKGELSLLLEQIDSLSIQIDLTTSDINEIKMRIDSLSSGSSEEEVRELPQRLSKCLKKIGEIKKGIQDAEEQIVDIKQAITKNIAILQKNSNNPNVSEAIKKEKFASRLRDLFEDSISQFREKLKRNVERDASFFFKTISNDPEYDHLVINNSYGLQIVGKDGEIIPHRSSGYEQVVAISLISALHKNAPIEGPIFMDSTFQRVDGRHKQKIIKNLHSFGHQVIVLAYYGEMGDVNEVKGSLGSHLLKENHLRHISKFETVIE